MTDRLYMGVNKITVNVSDEPNILDADIWAITDDMDEDLVEIKFTPNTVEGVAAKQWAKGWLIRIDHDGTSDVWDSYIKDDVVNPLIPEFIVVFDTVTAGVEGTEVWTFQSNKCYVANRGDLTIDKEQERGEGVVFVICIGTVAVTHP